MRDIKKVPENPEDLIGCEIESYSGDTRDPSYTFHHGKVVGVHFMYAGNRLQLDLEGGGATCVHPSHDYWIRVLEEPETPAKAPAKAPAEETLSERVTRLDAELASAREELARNGLPPGMAPVGDRIWSITPVVSNQEGAQIRFAKEPADAVYLRSSGPMRTTHIHFAELAGWVDYIREKGLAPGS